MTTMYPSWSQMMKVNYLCETEAYMLSSANVWPAVSVIQSGFLDVNSERVGSRAVPSAGAIYPYDMLIVTREEGETAIFKIDPARRVCQHLDSRPYESLLNAGLPNLPERGAHLIILTCPWLSMRKYGMRGYVYAQLDAAHLGANLLGSALASQYQAELRLRVSRRALREALANLNTHREVACVLTISSNRRVQPIDGWTIWRRSRSDSGQDCDLLGEMQLLCWQRIPEQLHDSTGEPTEPALQPPISYPAPSKSASDLLARWHDLSRSRCSSSGFISEPIHSSTFERVFSASTLSLPLDFTSECPVTLCAYSPPSQSSTDADWTMRACNGQQHLRDAQAFAVLHADADQLLASDRPHVLREAFFKAGVAGHLLYLAATAEQVGVTAVGGFQGPTWREILGLPSYREILYVVAMGCGRRGGVKYDRASLAHAHGV